MEPDLVIDPIHCSCRFVRLNRTVLPFQTFATETPLAVRAQQSTETEVSPNNQMDTPKDQPPSDGEKNRPHTAREKDAGADQGFLNRAPTGLPVLGSPPFPSVGKTL
jgi:hypothetical protein